MLRLPLKYLRLSMVLTAVFLISRVAVSGGLYEVNYLIPGSNNRIAVRITGDKEDLLFKSSDNGAIWTTFKIGKIIQLWQPFLV